MGDDIGSGSVTDCLLMYLLKTVKLTIVSFIPYFRLLVFGILVTLVA